MLCSAQAPPDKFAFSKLILNEVKHACDEFDFGGSNDTGETEYDDWINHVQWAVLKCLFFNK